MFTVIRTADKSTPYVVELVVDKEADVANVPVNTYLPGSTCIVIESSNVYMLNNEKEWKLL